MLIATLELNKKKYKLQHPGPREWIKLKQASFNPKTESIDLEKILDYAFEHVVIPLEGDKLKIDDFENNIEELEDWELVIPCFFRGELVKGYRWKDICGRPNKSQEETKRFLQERN